MKIGAVSLDSPVALAPMAGMTDTAFRRLVKRLGGCGLVVSEMVSSEGLVRGIDRTLEYAEYTEEERPVSIQIFGGDPAVMADAAQIVEGMGADIIDVNMGCPVPKIAKHHAGCSLMREPEHAAGVIRAMTRAVGIPVTVKMRAGWNEHEINAPRLARLVEDAGAAAVAVHGRTAAQSYSGESDWSLIARVAEGVTIPVFGSGDCVEPEHIVDRLENGRVGGVLVGRGALRNPWIFAQVSEQAAGRCRSPVALEERGRFLLDYIDLLMTERVNEAAGFRHTAPGQAASGPPAPARGRERWVINKLRALGAWYTKGLEGGSDLRVAVNHAKSVPELRGLISEFFLDPVRA
ncbi:MAG TPA: tRNA dihydrouridine synthase DusB [Vicinamibacterales bacterium]|nr:tRNA dihydrouridine synthase DusB [Vicinamibacterales bacterium]